MRLENEVGPDVTTAEANRKPEPHHAAGTADYIAGLRRRRAATYRLPVLACGCADPWTCRHHTKHGSVTDQFVDGYRDAAEHLLASGLTPPPNLPAMRAMWKRGGHDQRLAVRIAELWQVAAA
uniref:Uncharacterized protein n=2 Tax=unclassified Mycobacterium TaxID=2642494 RepID=A0A5Q5BKW4_MYCSS